MIKIVASEKNSSNETEIVLFDENNTPTPAFIGLAALELVFDVCVAKFFAKRILKKR